MAGGVERVLTLKANYFADVYGYDITIVTTDGENKENYFPLSSKVKVVNLCIHFDEMWHHSFLKRLSLYLPKERLFKKKLTEELKAKSGIEVDRKNVSLNAPINKIGDYTMLIKLTSKVKCEVAVSVTASEILKESVEEEVVEAVEE